MYSLISQIISNYMCKTDSLIIHYSIYIMMFFIVNWCILDLTDFVECKMYWI